MLAITFFAVASASILTTQAVKSFNSTILSEEIIYYQNEYLSLEIIGEGDDSIIYMNVDKTINARDDIFIKLRLKHDRNSPVISIQSEINLCTLLWKEVNEPNGIQATYMMSQAFNLDGHQCPIQEKTMVKLVPWVLIKKHNFNVDMTCGKYHYELTLDQCRPYVTCNSLIVADLEVTMRADNCYQ